MGRFFLIRYWKGEGSLARVFWLYGVIPSTLAIALVAWAAATGRIGERSLAGAIAALFVYTAWILVSVWRCAARRGEDDLYGIMARWLTVAWAINAILVGGFVLVRLLAS
ncbi:hypothetical protein [Pelomicrobium sp.]|jgi:hypothetical protein|uniref:hypothetical protein n=1 Tax=Pelomicrobium sp. TaxID=2815319 RepID=UPI002FDCE333